MGKISEWKSELIIIGLFVFIMICTLVTALIQTSTPSTAATRLDMPLQTAFIESGAAFEMITAQSWELIDTNYHDGKELAGYYEGIKNVLGDDDLLSFDEYDDDAYAGISVAGQTEQGYNIDLVLQSMGSSKEAETYLIVNLTDPQNIQDMNEIQAYFGNIFAAVSLTTEPSIMIEGIFDHELSKWDKKKTAKALFRAVDGDIREKNAGDGYISYSGYTDAIANSVESGSHKVNLQVAMSDNEEEGQTHIYIGTPVVFSDF